MFTSVKNNIRLVLIVVLLIAVSSHARFSIMVTKGVINSICTKDKRLSSLCFEVLKPTSEIAKLDLFGLTKYLINYQSRNLSDTMKQLKLFADNTTDFRTHNMYTTCIEDYDSALYYNQYSLKDLAAKDYDGLNTRIGGVGPEMYACSDGLLTVKPIPQLLIKKCNFISDLSSIMLVILEYFIRNN
ncbi:hypothetical protein CARUB_v10002809mg [Capsella rubella]|uniref:Pectinesterase inhibitor domain-containing protein n=1 Tax=Capsella rubella TaxID=81985 RepID=R0FIK8_9BRAS|nr:hypothetical protein CARUB_v10002809mg [Capsella rubella]